MREQNGMLTIWLVIGLNFLLIVGTVALLRRRRRQGRLSAGFVAAATAALLSVLIITIFMPLVSLNPTVAQLFQCGLVAFVWAVLYPLMRWLYPRLFPPGDEG